MIERFAWRGNRWVNKQTGEPLVIGVDNIICRPMIQSDIAPYKSPLGEHWIDGRRAQREELRRNDMVINESRMKTDPDEYKHRKAEQAKYLEKRKAGLI